jgi:hypothetical protein
MQQKKLLLGGRSGSSRLGFFFLGGGLGFFLLGGGSGSSGGLGFFFLGGSVSGESASSKQTSDESSDELVHLYFLKLDECEFSKTPSR